MGTTKITDKQIKAPYNKANAAAIKTWADAITDEADALAVAGSALLTTDVITADANGRKIFQAGLFDAATVALKFAAGCFAANATIRALFAAGLIDSATATSIIAAGAIPISKVAPSSIDGTQIKVGAAGNTVGILPELFIIDCADGAAAVTEKTTLDSTYGKIIVKDVYFVKGPTTGGATDSVQLCTDAGGTTPVSSILALNGIVEGGVVRTTSLLNTTFAAGAKFYVKRVQTTNNAGTMMILAYRIA